MKTNRYQKERRFAVFSIIVVVLVLAAHILWASLERSPMLWDDALYAAASLNLYDGIDAKGLAGLAERFIHTSGARAPLVSLLPLPLFLAFGRGSVWAFYTVEFLAFVLVCLAAYRLVRRLSNGFGAFVAVVLLCVTPLLAGVGIVIAAVTVVPGGMMGYLFAAVLLIAGLLVRRFWTGRLPPGTERCLVILGVAYIVAGFWYSENVFPLLRFAWHTSFE